VNKRWTTVGAIGLLCGLLLGWLLYALTASVPAAVVVGASVAAILLVLAVGGARHNSTFRATPDRAAEAAAKRARVQRAIEETRRDRP
jgi:hypothetical protein